jgi:hypothetical protein
MFDVTNFYLFLTVLTCLQHFSCSPAVLSQVCSNGHANLLWCSQPKFPNGIPLMDVQMAAGIILSGNNFDKIRQLHSLILLPCVEPNLFSGIQRHYVIPAIQEMWDKTIRETLDKYRGVDLIVCGKSILSH